MKPDYSPIPNFNYPQLKSVLLYEKKTRWETFCRDMMKTTDASFMETSYPSLLKTYKSHIISIQFIKYLFEYVYQVDYEHVRIDSINSSQIETFDAIIAAGGDGTYLEAASFIPSSIKWTRRNKELVLFGVNTDPKRSEGFLLLDSSLSTVNKSPFNSHKNHFINNKLPEILKSFDSTSEITQETNSILDIVEHQLHRIFQNVYTPILRRRIRMTLKESNFDLKKNFSKRKNSNSPELKSHDIISDPPLASNFNSFASLSSLNLHAPTEEFFLALNEIFISSQQSHSTLYLEYSIDNGPLEHSKNSGLLVCTGSGSTAWAFNISKISEKTVENVINQFKSEQPLSVQESLIPTDPGKICKDFNNHLIFNCSNKMMRIVFREPVQNRIFTNAADSVMGKQIFLRPLIKNAIICLDGVNVIPLKFGQALTLNIMNDDDAIITAI